MIGEYEQVDVGARHSFNDEAFLLTEGYDASEIARRDVARTRNSAYADSMDDPFDRIDAQTRRFVAGDEFSFDDIDEIDFREFARFELQLAD